MTTVRSVSTDYASPRTTRGIRPSYRTNSRRGQARSYRSDCHGNAWAHGTRPCGAGKRGRARRPRLSPTSSLASMMCLA
jgi:hypothetical protein